MKLKTISILLSLLVLICLPVMANNTKELPSDAASEQVLHTFNDMDGSYIDLMKTMYNRCGYPQIVQLSLTAFDKNFEIDHKAGAAKSWEVSDDKLTWTFNLKENLKWSDGSDLTASDFVFALHRAIEKGYDFSWYYSWAADIKNWTKVEADDLPLTDLGIKAVDDYTLKVTTNSIKPFLPSILNWWYPVPEHVVEEYGDEYATKAETLVCSGPFVVTEWVKGEKIVYEPNPEYNGDWKPYVDKIVEMIGTGNAEVGFASYMAGELDLSPVNPGQLQFVKQRMPDELRSWSDFQILYLTMDSSKDPFQNEKVRKAIALAIDRERIANTALDNLVEPLTTILTPGYPGYNEDLTDKLKYDPERARELLAEAGYPDGEGLPTIQLHVRNEDAIMHIQKPLAQYVQNQLQENLGVNMEIKIVEMKTWYSQLTEREHNFFLSPYAKDFFEPSNFLGLFTSSGREPWSNETYDEMVNTASKIMDAEERFSEYKKAEEYFLEKVPAVPLVAPIKNEVWKPYLSGEAVTANEDGIVARSTIRYWYTHVYLGEK